jgi:hypothetical protein
VTCNAFAAETQKDMPTSMAGGAQLGLNINNYSSSPEVSSSSRGGLIIGALLELGFNEYVFIQPEMRYTQKGFEYRSGAGSEQVLIEATANYIEIPVLFKFKLFADSFVRPYFVLGPNIGFKASDTVDVTLNNGQNSETRRGTLNLKYTTLDFAMDIGGGVEWYVNADLSLFVQGRYSYGLIDVAESSTMSWKSRGIQFSGGALFYF